MIPLMKNAFLEEHRTKDELVEFIKKTDRLSMGVYCEQFEKEFAEFQGSKDAILVNSGGSANLAILQTLKNMGKLKDGDNIGFSAITWSTNVMPIIQLGLVPVPIDCNRFTLNAMSSNIKNALKEVNLKALFLTNVLGFCGDMESIRDLCNEEKIIFLEDNCEALGTEVETGKTGSFGLLSSFSFFVAHHMSTIEGGMICTDDEEIGEMLRIVRANGWDRNLTAAQQRKWRKNYNVRSELEAKYTFYDLGLNIRPTEITGFLGLTQLKYLEQNINIREKNYRTLENVVRENKDLIVSETSHIHKLSSFAFPVICTTPETRSKYLSKFAGAGVEIRPMIAGNIQRQPFFKKYVTRTFNLPEADFIHDNSFYCGNYPDLSDMDIQILQNCLCDY